MNTAALLTALVFGFAQGKDGFPEVPAADAKAMEKLKTLGALAMPLAANTNVITVDFRAVADQVNDAVLESLKPVADQLVWLNLASTKVTDAGLAQLAGLKNLQRLHLEKTGVGDAGLEHLKGLSEVRYLNLYGTKVSDKGLASIAALKKLENVFLWMTPVSDAGEAELAKALPKTHINRGWKEPPKAPEETKPETAAAKPINAKCPVKGEPVKADVTFVYKGQTIAFC